MNGSPSRWTESSERGTLGRWSAPAPAWSWEADSHAVGTERDAEACAGPVAWLRALSRAATAGAPAAAARLELPRATAASISQPGSVREL